MHEALRPIRGVLPAIHKPSTPYFFPGKEYSPHSGNLELRKLFLVTEGILRQSLSIEHLGPVAWFLIQNKEYWLPIWNQIRNFEESSRKYEESGGPIPALKSLHDSIATRILFETKGAESWIESERLYTIFRPDSLYEGLLDSIQKRIAGPAEDGELHRLVSQGLALLNGALIPRLDWLDSEKTVGWLQRSVAFVQCCTGRQREEALRWLGAVFQLGNEPLGFYVIDQMSRSDVAPETREVFLAALERSNSYHGASLLLRMSLTKGVDDMAAYRALIAARRIIPEFCFALRDYLDFALGASNAEDRSARLSYISSAGGYAGEYWGDFCLTIFERPLRLLKEQGLSVPEAHRSLAPALSRSVFLFAYGLADGIPTVVAEINSKLERVFSKFDSPELISTVEDAKTSLEHRRDVVLTKLKYAFIQSAFVPSPAGVKNLAFFDEAYRSDRVQDNEFWQTAKYPSMYELQRFANLIETSASLVRWDTHEILSCRLAVRSNQNPDGIPALELAKRFGFDDATTEALAVSISMDPLRPGPHAERIRRNDVHQWTIGGYQSAQTEQLLQVGLTGESIEMLRANNLFDAARVYLRAHTIKGNFELALMLAQAINHMDPPNHEGWRAWRYDIRKPHAFEQLARPWVDGTWTTWIENQILVFKQQIKSSDGGKVLEYDVCWYFTDDPLFLFSLGNTPTGQRSCSAYDGGTYYSGSLVSYVCDAHIKAGILFSVDSLKQTAPALYAKFKDHTVRPHDLARSRPEIIESALNRTVIKIAKDASTNGSALLCEPTFVNGTMGKFTPYLCAELAEYCLGRRMGAKVYLDPSVAGDKSLIVVPKSCSPFGQVENWDGMIWLATQKDVYGMMATKAPPCAQEGPYGLSFHYADRIDSALHWENVRKGIK